MYLVSKVYPEDIINLMACKVFPSFINLSALDINRQLKENRLIKSEIIPVIYQITGAQLKEVYNTKDFINDDDFISIITNTRLIDQSMGIYQIQDLVNNPEQSLYKRK